MDDYKVRDRSAKVARRKSRMPVHGIAMKRLLNEQAAKAQHERNTTVNDCDRSDCDPSTCSHSSHRKPSIKGWATNAKAWAR